MSCARECFVLLFDSQCTFAGFLQTDTASEEIHSENLKTTDINIVEMCQQSFSFPLPSDSLHKRFEKKSIISIT